MPKVLQDIMEYKKGVRLPANELVYLVPYGGLIELHDYLINILDRILTKT